MRRRTVEKGALHGSGSGFVGGVLALAADLADLPQQCHNRVNARVQRFAPLDLGHRVKWHPTGVGQLFNLGP